MYRVQIDFNQTLDVVLDTQDQEAAQALAAKIAADHFLVITETQSLPEFDTVYTLTGPTEEPQV